MIVDRIKNEDLREVVEYLLLFAFLVLLDTGAYTACFISPMEGLILLAISFFCLAECCVSFVRRVRPINQKLIELEKKLKEEELR